MLGEPGRNRAVSRFAPGQSDDLLNADVADGRRLARMTATAEGHQTRALSSLLFWFFSDNPRPSAAIRDKRPIRLCSRELWRTLEVELRRALERVRHGENLLVLEDRPHDVH